MNNFHKDLAFSHSDGAAALFADLYRRYFGQQYLGHMVSSVKSEAQFRGVDTVVFLRQDKIIRVDEKIRRGQDYGDIALEIMSNDRKGTQGWATKDVSADYFAYAIESSQTAYMLPALLLRRTVSLYSKGWEERHEGKRIVAKNQGYGTICVCVPPDVLFRDMAKAMLIQGLNGGG